MSLKEKIGEKTRYLLIVEGSDDKAFFEKLFNDDITSDYQILVLEGRDNLRKGLRLVKNDPNYDNVRKILIVRDADENPETASNSVVGAVRDILEEEVSNILNESSGRIGILILPNSEEEGSLEDFILSNCDETIVNIIDGFIVQLEEKNIEVQKKSKYKLHCYFGAKCSDRLYIKLSAALKNCNFIDFYSSERVVDLKEKVLRFLRGN